MNVPLDSKPDPEWLSYRLNHYECFFNKSTVQQLLALAEKMDVRTGTMEQGIKCHLQNKVVDSSSISELEGVFRAWEYICRYPPY